MRRGHRFPDDQAEVVFSDVLLEQLELFTAEEQVDILAEVVRLCEDRAGKHPLSGPLAGWNTLDVLSARHRVVYEATLHEGVGLLEVLCVGPRSDSEVYDMAMALTQAELLSDEEVTQLWDTLGLLDVVTQDLGLDGWDYRPEPAPDGMRKAAVRSGLLDDQAVSLWPKTRSRPPCSGGGGPMALSPPVRSRRRWNEREAK